MAEQTRDKKGVAVRIDRKGVHFGEKALNSHTSIRIDPELWKEVKIAAIRNDMGIFELVENALRHELEKLKKRDAQ